jgi:hypothetical protein
MVNLFGIDENLGTNGVVAQPTNIIFLQENNIIYTFNNNLLRITFPMYKKTGNLFNYNGVFSGMNQKIIIDFHILYRWLDMEYAPRFNFKIIINDIEYLNRNLGVSDEMDVNNFSKSIIVDLKPNDRIEFLFITDFETNQKIEIIDNSHYILRSF